VNKLAERLLVFFIGLPLCLSLAAFLPQKNNLSANLLVTVFCVLGAVELSVILKRRGLAISRAGAGLLGAAIPSSVTLFVSFGVNALVVPALAALCGGILLVREAFARELRGNSTIRGSGTGHDGGIARIAAGFMLLLYPASFMSWLILINLPPHSPYLIISFLCLVFANDSLAWAAGMLFGGTNRGIFAVSPNKSAAGFIFGIAASVAVSLALPALLPDVFASSRLPPVVSGIILGVLTGAAAVLGDLAESAIKRCAGLKDSGSLMPGRGGILDSVDSLALAAPVFFIAYRLLYA
jgi:phosphatidate cytidylyltransferase